jgi:hypothetical protein
VRVRVEGCVVVILPAKSFFGRLDVGSSLAALYYRLVSQVSNNPNIATTLLAGNILLGPAPRFSHIAPSARNV